MTRTTALVWLVMCSKSESDPWEKTFLNCL